MKNIFNGIMVSVIVLLVVVVSGAVYVLDETEQGVITQFGKPIGSPVVEAGLNFKMPFIQKVHYFDKRLLEWDGSPTQVPTRDKRYIWVDTTARWKITDALVFLQAVGTEPGLHARLDDIVNSATRDVITNNILVEVVRDSNRILVQENVDIQTAFAEEALEEIELGRQTLEEAVLERARIIVPRYGIELVDVRIKRINYVQGVRERIYERMVSERKRVAEQYRSEGMGRSSEIKGQAERELNRITSDAFREAQIIRGEADAEATSIYAESYGNDPDFYAFLKTLDTYNETVGSGTTVILTTDSDYYRYFKEQK